jgi:ATP-binding cassette, subfamily B, bacterial
VRSELRAVTMLFWLAFRADPFRAGGTLAAAGVDAVAQVSWSYLLKLLTDSVVAGDVRGAVIAVLAYGGSLIVTSVTTLARVQWTAILREKATFLVDRQLAATAMALPTLEHHERPDFADRLQLLRSRHANLGEAIDGVVGNLRILVMFTGMALLLAHIHLALLLLPVFALPAFWSTVRAARLSEQARAATVTRARMARHLFELATRVDAAKELRVFGLAPAFIAEHDALSAEEDQELRRASLRGVLLTTAGWGVFAAAYIGALVFVTLRAVDTPAQTTIGDVFLTYALALQTQALVRDAAGSLTSLWRDVEIMRHFAWITDMSGSLRSTSRPGRPPVRIRREMTLEDVTFRYPGETRDVLKDVTLSIPAGSVVALVGENGSGKTTLVKLLCRLYEPTRGAVSLDGISLASIEVDQWRRQVSAAFQDFAHLEFLARETVGVGDLTSIESDAAVSRALERGRGEDVVATLPAGLRTPLGKTFPGGVELSLGQWQKLALSRAMMRERPLLLVLDEPTASLDAETEHALFESYTAAARRLAAVNGAITILVSHRFTTVSMADLIVVLRNGELVEIGSHWELIGRGSLYAELYALQARSYGFDPDQQRIELPS